MSPKNAFSLFQDGGLYDSFQNLKQATDLAEEFSASYPASVFTVVDSKDIIRASATQKRILGQFEKQKWTGPKNDYAEPVGTVEFDATDYVLSMNLGDILELDDAWITSDPVGIAHVQWSGPYAVYIVEAVCSYFGIQELSELTQEHLSFVQNRIKPEPAREITVTVTAALKINMARGIDIKAVLSSMGYAFVSENAGAVVTKLDLTDWAYPIEAGMKFQVDTDAISGSPERIVDVLEVLETPKPGAKEVLCRADKLKADVIMPISELTKETVQEVGIDGM